MTPFSTVAIIGKRGDAHASETLRAVAC